MELSFLLFQKILSMALIMLCGFSVRKAGLVKTEQIPIISILLLYIVVPCTVFKAFILEYTSERMLALIIAFVGGLFVQVFFIFLAWLLKRSPFRANSIEQACLAYPNCGNLIIPLITGILGDEYVFFLAALLAVTVFSAWVHMPRLLSGDYKVEWKKLAANPNIIAIAAGFLCFIANIRLPGILVTTIDGISGSIGTISMLLTGLLMAGVDLKAIFSKPRSYAVSLMRLILFPFILIVIIALTGITRSSELTRNVLMVLTIGASAPVATMVLQMANVFGGDAETASAINAMTTILCIVTMPLMLWVYQLMCC